MFLKAAFKNASVFVQILMLLAIISLCTFFSVALVSLLISVKMGTSPEVINNILQNFYDYPDLMRSAQFIQTVGVFLLPAIVCAWLFSDNYKEYLRIDHPIHLPIAVWAVVSMIVAVPFLNLTYSFNQQMLFPEAFRGLENWMKASETEADKLTQLLLDTKSTPTIIFNFLAICVIAALCEEFMFRGLLQTLLGRIFRNPHVIIWAVAILFSAVHLQFYGFITRMLLGAWLGYLMYFTKTIWIPVLAHFTNNFLTVGIYYLFRNAPDEMQKLDTIGSGSTWWIAIASLTLFIFCFVQIKKRVTNDTISESVK